MSELDDFIRIIRDNSNDNFPLKKEQVRIIISELNKFLYTTHANIGTIQVFDEKVDYFSPFHKYWHAHYMDILELEISDARCKLVADALHEVYKRTKGKIFRNIYKTYKLTNEQICRIRFLTANQDFRGSRDFHDFVKIYRKNNCIFDEKNIVKDPGNFIKRIKVQSLSQNDKRIRYAQNAAQFLLDNNCEPYKMIDAFKNDVFELRKALIEYQGAGYGNKKADMFIRDMVVLNVWPQNTIKGFDKIDVASDINTLKIALRTGILTSKIPLLSSFMDIFCYQYAYADKMSAKAWRRVFELWNQYYPNETIASPCLLDYFIYDVIGKQFCHENLYVYRCDYGHEIKSNNSLLKKCVKCKNPVSRIDKKLPCDDEEGYKCIQRTEFYKSNIAGKNFKECPFKKICDEYGHKNLQPPKSISILGQTGWINGYSKTGEGGGGIMA